MRTRSTAGAMPAASTPEITSRITISRICHSRTSSRTRATFLVKTRNWSESEKFSALGFIESRQRNRSCGRPARGNRTRSEILILSPPWRGDGNGRSLLRRRRCVQPFAGVDDLARIDRLAVDLRLDDLPLLVDEEGR